MSELLAGAADNPQIENVIALVQERALPHSDGQIVREDILKRFGVTGERDLFPAPAEFEQVKYLIKREQHETLLNNIVEASAPIIIHAEGGVGKSVVSRQLAESLPIGSLGIVYDCFGSGKYRNRSEPRHRHRDALVQVANEIASCGLCEPLVPRSTDLDDALLRAFLARLHAAATALRKVYPDAVLVVFIDAADNAEMAAKEFSEPCFAHHLLREAMPDGCRIVALCRTERVNLLEPASEVRQFELKPFSKAETLVHLRERFPAANQADGLEFHRMTAGNPRVQANSLSIGHNTVSDVLVSLGPSGTTIDEQIAAQLNFAISSVKEAFPVDFQQQIEAICLGLANLPPLIPIDVLATVAGVNVAAVKSFVADLGRPLWLSDSSVQFRDEPTETWFRQKFSASSQQIESYVARLKPLALRFAYVAEALPSLLLQSENYEQLISLALSDDCLPEDSPIDQRNARVFRLQFAFKAALKQKRYEDAAKLALRAGEEVAGDQRQLELLRKNTDLIAPLQSQQRVQELSFRRMLRGAWDGSENAYSAALLSSDEDFKGEARGYLRAAHNWLRSYFEERKKQKQDMHNDERLKDEDIVELALAHFHLSGPRSLVEFILSWRPPDVIFRVSRLFIRRLVDAGNFLEIDQISRLSCRRLYFMIAITEELMPVGRVPPADAMGQCLDLVIHKRTRIRKPRSLWEDKPLASAIISFLEASAATGLSHTKILRALRYYFSQRASRSISSDYQESERNLFLRGAALKAVLLGNHEPDLESLMPKELVEKKKNNRDEQDIKEFEQIIGGLLPLHIVHSRILTGDRKDLNAAVQNANQHSTSARSERWREYDRIPFEITPLRFEILALDKASDDSEIVNFAKALSDNDNKYWLNDHLRAVRTAYRLDHLSKIRDQLEQTCRERVKSATDEGPETRAEWYINLARAVLPISRADAATYFDLAIEAVSKFGDEIVERWEAVVAVAKRTAEGGHVAPELAYRFIRCAELVGDNVAREKHWDRDDAVKVCARLRSTSAFAALSRWRDRDVGWFDEQLSALAYELVESRTISPSVGWSLAAFEGCYQDAEFAVLCIENEPDAARRQYILNAAIRDLRLGETSERSWQKIESVAQRFSLENIELRCVLNFYAEQSKTDGGQKRDQISCMDPSEESQGVDWEKVFDGLDLSKSGDLNEAIGRFKSMPAPRYREVFWNELFRRVPETEAKTLLYAIATAEKADLYDIQESLSHFPDNWRSKVSVERVWPQILSSIGQRFAPELTNRFRLEYFLKEIRAEADMLSSIQKGVLNGLSESYDLADASTFFGFAGLVSSLISPRQGADLLDFALSRFEEHIEEDYADGPWANWMTPPEEVTDAFTGFVWAALGSPRSAIRWQAVHSIRRLAEAGCEREIEALIRWMSRDHADAFGSHKFPFYNLHARQYLLIAMARTAIDNPEILRRHHSVFAQQALEGIPHALIQKYAAKIALCIETAFPGTYDPAVGERLQRVGVSPMPTKEIDGYGQWLESPWHARGEIDQSLKLHFAYDFDRYWFEPLAEVYGISEKQVEDLARQVVYKDWHTKIDDEFIRDPRAKLWRSNRHERETWHSHSNYPRTEDYSFYISYHAMLVVGAKLLLEMPFVNRRNSHEEHWSDWLRRHSLTRPDGRWLADRRDHAPLERRAWLQAKKSNGWRWEITRDDFLDGLLIQHNGETWVNIFGGWSDNDGEREESFYVSSALVSSETSGSLLNALFTCLSPRDFKLPDYEEDGMEFDTHPFELRGWIRRNYRDNGVDEYDPHAGTIDYPPFEIGKDITDRFGLTHDLEHREWRLPEADKISLRCELWSGKKVMDREGPSRQGKRLSASLTFLQKLCSVLERELIMKVEIERQLRRSYYSRSDDEFKYTEPSCKLYLLSADGKLRDEKTSYQLR